MKLNYLLFVIPIIFSSCDQQPKPLEGQAFIDSLDRVEKVDSIVQVRMKEMNHKIYFDTVGINEAPIKVVKVRFAEKEYSNYRDVSITFKNVSDKKIDGIKFRWYAENAFGEPADMGGFGEEGFGGGFSDKTINPGKSMTLTWNVMSRDGKKNLKAWPVEIAFTDGTKWNSSHN